MDLREALLPQDGRKGGILVELYFDCQYHISPETQYVQTFDYVDLDEALRLASEFFSRCVSHYVATYVYVGREEVAVFGRVEVIRYRMEQGIDS